MHPQCWASISLIISCCKIAMLSPSVPFCPGWAFRLYISSPCSPLSRLLCSFPLENGSWSDEWNFFFFLSLFFLFYLPFSLLIFLSSLSFSTFTFLLFIPLFPHPLSVFLSSFLSLGPPPSASFSSLSVPTPFISSLFVLSGLSSIP